MPNPDRLGTHQQRAPGRADAVRADREPRHTDGPDVGRLQVPGVRRRLEVPPRRGLAVRHVPQGLELPQLRAGGGNTATDWKVDRLGFLEGVQDGTWEADAQGTYVVLTLESHQKPVRKAKADEFRSYGNSDITAALIFRG